MKTVTWPGEHWIGPGALTNKPNRYTQWYVTTGAYRYTGPSGKTYADLNWGLQQRVQRITSPMRDLVLRTR